MIAKRKAEAISSGVFLISLGVLFYLNAWWPGILIAIWLFLAIRQFLCERYFDFAVSTFILLGLFIINIFNISWSYLGPLLFIAGGIYLILREYFLIEDRRDKDES
jgi:predicted membrane protein